MKYSNSQYMNEIFQIPENGFSILNSWIPHDSDSIHAMLAIGCHHDKNLSANDAADEFEAWMPWLTESHINTCNILAGDIFARDDRPYWGAAAAVLYCGSATVCKGEFPSLIAYSIFEKYAIGNEKLIVESMWNLWCNSNYLNRRRYMTPGHHFIPSFDGIIFSAKSLTGGSVIGTS